MRFGHILTYAKGFIIWPMKVRGGGYVRLGFLLMLTTSFVFAYLVYTTHEPLKMQAEEQPIEKDEPSFESLNTNQDDQKGDIHEDYLDAGFNQTFRRTHGIVPVQCDPSAQVSEILRMPPIKFLSSYKNPCWHEPLNTSIEDMYVNNGFAKYSFTYEKAFHKLTDKWLNMKSNISSRLRCLPYFFLVGQPKCGSTDFYNKIVSHPDVVIPPIKESHWWGKNRYGWCLNYTATIPFKDYVDLYDGAAMQIHKLVNKTSIKEHRPHHVITGDASVSTLWSNDDWWKNPENCGQLEPRFTNAHHVHFVLPQARIIVILRNPTDRLYSDFLFFQHSSKSKHYFHQEVELAIDSLNQCTLQVGIRACVYNYTIASKSRVRLRLGLYQIYLQEWLSLFPRNQVLVVRLEDYSPHPMRTIREVHKFLHLRSLSEEEHAELMDKPGPNTRRESDKRFGVMLPETRDLLNNFYRPYNVKLARLLGDNSFLWDDV